MHRGSLLTRFFHKGGWKLTSPQSSSTPRQLLALGPCTAPPAEGVLGVLGSSPCASCTSKFCEMLVLNLCVRISDFSKAGIGQRFVKMMCRSSSILPRSSKKRQSKNSAFTVTPVLRKHLVLVFCCCFGEEKEKSTQQKRLAKVA